MTRLQQMCQKTKLCRFYARGMCTRGGACVFAHGYDEVQPVPDLSRTKPCPVLRQTGVCQDPNCVFAHGRDEIRRLPVFGDERRPQCLKFAAGSLQEAKPRREEDAACMPYYQRPLPPPSMMLPMPLAMLPPETRTLLTSAMPVGNQEMMQQSGTSSRAPRNKFQKTKMCKLFLKGRCGKFGKCRFAHSEEEKQPLPNLSRTKLCPNLFSSGRCGNNDCMFAHSPEELRQWHNDNSVENSGNGVSTLAEQAGNEKKENHEPQSEALDHGGWDSPDEFFSQSDDFSRQVSDDLGDSFVWNRQQTEDPVALHVRKMRVENTFITVIEEEELGEKPRRRRARSAPALRSETIDRPQVRPQATQKPKEILPNAETLDFGAECKPFFYTSEDPFADSHSGKDLAMVHLQFGQAVSPAEPQVFQVAGSCDLALSAPSFVSSPSQHAASVPTQAQAVFKDNPLRIDSGLNDWPRVQNMPGLSQDPWSNGKPHSFQPAWGQKTPQAKLAWPDNFPLDYGMNQPFLTDWRQ
mmetsp:Transcript_1175/g.2150  ORF Transcript_1175/g.2150 Transcript_1175/m.2150 type:complete len:522 (+) Transcript_1175:91-1656(+)